MAAGAPPVRRRWPGRPHGRGSCPCGAAALLRPLRGREDELAHRIYAEDAVLEFPKSGERFEGVADFLAWPAEYPAQVDFAIECVRGQGDVWVVELRLRYDGRPWESGVDILEFRGDLVVRETACSMDPWEAPDWRARWRAAPPTADAG